jgi:hypothetical protein
MVGLFKILNAEFGKSNDSIGDKLLFLNQKKKTLISGMSHLGKKNRRMLEGVELLQTAVAIMVV